MFALGDYLCFFKISFPILQLEKKKELMKEKLSFTLATHYSFPLLNNAIYHTLPIFQKCCMCSFFYMGSHVMQLFKNPFIGLQTND